ncbi:MAG: type 4a pilus biogenesis protein PilO [Deltaproteobacteria bacterium]|nr:type 4a pilus biogenesis protein PilO [Deltaproteobacteria bacterium]
MALSDTIERYSRLPQSTRVAVIVAITAAIAAAFYFLLYADISDEAAALKRNVATAEADKAKYEARKQNYDAVRADVNRRLQEEKEVLKVLPADANIFTFLQSIHAQAALAGVNILTYDPQRERQQKFYAEIPVQMTISGTYHQISKFFYYMQSEKDVKRIVKIEDLLLGQGKAAPEGVVLRAQFVASTFRYVSQKNPAGGAG